MTTTDPVVEAVARAIDNEMYGPRGTSSSNWAEAYWEQAKKYANTAIAAVRAADREAGMILVEKRTIRGLRNMVADCQAAEWDMELRSGLDALESELLGILDPNWGDDAQD